MKTVFSFFKYVAFGSIFLLSHLHADFYQDFARANQASDAYLSGRTDDWQTPATLFIQGFNELNGRLQAIWRSLVGNGESFHAWNGVPWDKKKQAINAIVPLHCTLG